MLSLLSLVLGAVLSFEPPPAASSPAPAGAPAPGAVVEAPAEDDASGSLAVALQQSPLVVLADVVATHEVDGQDVEEAEVRSVLKGTPAAGRLFYEVASCGCGGAPKTKPGTAVLLFLKPGTDVQQRRSFWQALDKLAKPGEFFELSWGPDGHLASDGDGAVRTWLSLPPELPKTEAAAGESARVQRIALDALVAWVQERLAAESEPLR